jgi:hypothetical protein
MVTAVRQYPYTSRWYTKTGADFGERGEALLQFLLPAFNAGVRAVRYQAPDRPGHVDPDTPARDPLLSYGLARTKRGRKCLTIEGLAVSTQTASTACIPQVG